MLKDYLFINKKAVISVGISTGSAKKLVKVAISHLYKKDKVQVMAKTIRIQIRVTRNQYERAKSDAQAKGYTTLSSYIRSLMFTADFSIERKIEEIHFQIIKGDGFDKKNHKLKERPLTEYLEI